MNRRFGTRSLVQRLTLINGLCVLVLALLLFSTVLDSTKSTAMQTLQRESELRASQTVTRAERVAELCNMTTQVFLNSPALIEHLEKLAGGETMDALAQMQFYRQVIGSLEKISLSNPDLYQIRVYSTVSNIQEMLPILYGAGRMEGLPWADDAVHSGAWHFDYPDRLFSDDPNANRLLGLTTDIRSKTLGRTGVLEVLVRMDETLPALFEDDGQNYAMLADASGNVLAGVMPGSAARLPDTEANGLSHTVRIGGKRMLMIRHAIRDMDCDFIQLTSLEDIDRAIVKQALILSAALVCLLFLITFVTNRTIQRMLRGFYGAFDSMRAFANGDIDARTKVRGQDEVAKFAAEANGVMDRITELIKENVSRQVQSANMEIRALYNQINAHFIYNVLEAIKMMAEIDEKYDIADAVTSLGKLLRYSMKWENGNVHLAKELDYIRNYIALMNLRFDYTIRLNIDIPDEMLYQRIPKISLQPIVENAVVHGAAILAADTEISVVGSVDRERGRCAVAVTDLGGGMDEAQVNRLMKQIEGEEAAQSSSGNGIGLNNVHSRIKRSFGPSFGLSVDSAPGRGTTVTVTLPYRVREGEQG